MDLTSIRSLESTRARIRFWTENTIMSNSLWSVIVIELVEYPTQFSFAMSQISN